MRIHLFILMAAMLFTATLTWYLARNSDIESDKAEEPTIKKSVMDKSEEAVPAKKTAHSKIDMRKLVRQVIEREVRPLGGVSKVNSYLNLLKQRAQEKQEVTALELEPGIEAIGALESIVGHEEMYQMRRAFLNEMSALSKSFGHVPEPPKPLTPIETEKLLDEIENEVNSETRQQGIKEYIEKANTTGDRDQQIMLMARLDNVIAKNRVEPNSPNLDTIAESIQNAENNELKQKAIREYLDAADQLDPEKQIQAIARLKELAAPNHRH